MQLKNKRAIKNSPLINLNYINYSIVKPITNKEIKLTYVRIYLMYLSLYF
jgi:hypothetical protein